MLGILLSSRQLEACDSEILSPLLFIIVIEALSRLLERAREVELVKGVKVGRGDRQIELSHLCFADDTLIFCQPEERIILQLRCILLCFQTVSG